MSLDVSSGEVLVVMGPSGSGKSTLIRTFNGLETLDGGELDVLGVRLDAAHEERQVRAIRERHPTAHRAHPVRRHPEFPVR